MQLTKTQLSQMALAAEAMITNEVFIRRFQVRTPNHLVLPPVPLLSQFDFPKDSVYHFVAMDGVQEGPSSSDPLLSQIQRKMPVEAVREITSHEGKPTALVLNLQSLLDAWHRNNKRFRKVRDAIAESPSDQTLSIINYAWLTRLYRYTRSIYTERYRWFNTWATVFDKIEKIAQSSPRVHYVFTDLPVTIPSMQRMGSLVGKPDQSVIRILTDPKEWMLFEFWKWLDPKSRSTSLFGRVAKEHLGQVRLVIEDNGRFICFDLGLVDSWIEQATSTVAQKTRIKPVDMQKRVLRGMMGLQQFRTPTVVEEVDSTNPDATIVAPVTAEDTQAATTNVEDVESAQDRADKILSSLDEDMAQLDSFDSARMVTEPAPDDLEAVQASLRPLRSFNEVETVAQTLTKHIDSLADQGVVSAPEYRKVQKLIEKAAQLPSPYASDILLSEFADVPPHMTVIQENFKIPDSPTLLDKSMLSASLKDFDPVYIKDILPRDVTASVHAIQKAGLIVTDYQIEKNEDAMSGFEFHTVRITPLVGLPSTVRFKLPAIDESGKIRTGGTLYRYRKQRIDVPIRKISESQVSLSSYYGKNFVSRCERASYDYSRWLQREIMLASIAETPTVSHLQTADVFDQSSNAPRAYTAISHAYKSFVKDGIVFNFQWSEREKLFGAERVAQLHSQELVPVGGAADGKLYALDFNNTLYVYENEVITPLDTFTTFLGIGDEKTPLEFAECRIFGKNIPTGLVLAYYYGLSELIKMLGATVRRVDAGQRLNLQPNEWSLAFEDQSLVFSRDDRLTSMILGGLCSLEKSLKNYSVYMFDQQGVYLNILEQAGMGVRYLRELDSLDKLFVDPITERVLKRMKEPTTYRGLIKRASELLLLDEHPRLLDARYTRWKSNERIAGAIYTELVQATREHNAKVNKSNARIEMNPYSVWKRLTQDDPGFTQIKDINPIQNLKEMEAVTFSGHGGRSSRSMGRASRYFDPTEMGLTSEATSDSKDVAINTVLSASPRFDTLEGMVKEPLYDKTPITSLLSTTALISPSAVSDEGKRLNFVNVQHSHGVACKSYFPSPVRTGFEETIAHKVDEGFATAAKQNGIVKSINNDGMIVEYEDKSTHGISLGRRFGASSGMTIPHDLVTELKVGESFKAGDILAYHKGFFKPDRFNPKIVRWMNGTLARVALLESRQTHEDASSISNEFSGTFSTMVTTPKRIVVAFDQHIRNLVEVGTQISHSDPICIIEDAITADRGLFTETTLNTLKTLSGQTPRSKVSGTVDSIEIFYNGDKEDMNESLRALADKSDEKLRRKRRSAAKTVYTGQVDESYRINGEPLLMDTAVIIVYITHEVNAGIGDKLVVANQLKSVISEVYHYPVKTESGKPIDIIFGAKSIFDRIVGSPFEIGTTNVLLDLIGKRAAAIYKGLKT